MNSPAHFRHGFARAEALRSQGRLREAEQAYLQLAATGENREAALHALAELYLQARRPREAIDTLVRLTEEAPDSLNTVARLATLLDDLGQPEAAIGHYQRLLNRQPGLAAAHFNLALLYKKMRRYHEALAAYEKAIGLGIDRVQEVYSNVGVLYSDMRDAARASEMYRRALAIDPNYVPALFNLAGLLEESGERQQAVELYGRILEIDPHHWASLARLAHAQRFTLADDPLLKSLERAVDATRGNRPAQEELCFALGKALDDLGRYNEAFATYRSANDLGRLRHPPYHREAIERSVESLVNLFDRDWISGARTELKAAPIFICGMFRSGSTLVEQLLASHPSITAGGELEILPWLAARQLAPYPEGVRRATREALGRLGSEYMTMLRELFPDALLVTDKRPDNFLHLGLIKAVFPSARIIYTQRNALDNCLSVYFQQFDGRVAYATDLDDTAHFYRQHERLMQHWNEVFGEAIFTVNYDELVYSPEPVLRGLLGFLGLDWDQRCLDFQRAPGLVKTASVWQVRESLHSRSSGRWRNYASHLRGAEAVLAEQA